MKPFDLTAALRGKQVITREGRKVVEVQRLASLTGPDVKAVVFVAENENTPRTAFIDGKCLVSRAESKFDLFMASEKKFQLMWQHTGGTLRGSNYVGSIHNCIEDAERVSRNAAGGSKKFLGIFEYEE